MVVLGSISKGVNVIGRHVLTGGASWPDKADKNGMTSCVTDENCPLARGILTCSCIPTYERNMIETQTSRKLCKGRVGQALVV